MPYMMTQEKHSHFKVRNGKRMGKVSTQARQKTHRENTNAESASPACRA